MHEGPAVGNAPWKSKAHDAMARFGPGWPVGAWVVLRGDDDACLRLAVTGPGTALAATAVGDGDWRSLPGPRAHSLQPCARQRPARVPLRPSLPPFWSDPLAGAGGPSFLGAIVDVWGAGPPAWLLQDASLRDLWLWSPAQGPGPGCEMVEALVRHRAIRCVVLRHLHDLSGLPPWAPREAAGPPELLQQCRRSGVCIVATSRPPQVLAQVLRTGVQKDAEAPVGRHAGFVDWASLRVQT